MSSSESGISDESFSETEPLVFRNPDGTYSHVVKNSVRHSRGEKNGKKKNGDSSSTEDDDDSLINSELEYEFLQDDDQEFLLELMSSPQDVNDLISIFDKHRKVFLFLMGLQLALEIYFITMASINQEENVAELQQFYRNVETSNLTSVYWVIIGIELFVMAFYLPIGFYGASYHKVKYLRWFANICIAGLLSQVMLAYIQQFNILAFFLRLTSFLYAKFLWNICISLLLLPRYRGDPQGVHAT